MATRLPRRQWLQGTLLAAAGCPSWCAAADARPVIGLGFSLYGMKSLAPAEALEACAELGFSCVEWVAMPDWPTAPAQLSAAARTMLRDQLRRLGLRLSGVMENLPLLVDEAQRPGQLERLKLAGQLARELFPEARPLIETVLGGRPEQWDGVKQALAERLGEWARLAETHELTIAIKAHVSGAAHRPEHIQWLLEQVPSPALKAAFDQSHFALREISLTEALTVLLPHTAFIHIKDVRGQLPGFQFVLPGEGSIDYVAYLRQLAGASYRGDVVVEVSGQLHSRADYQPRVAARRCAEFLIPVWEQAGLARR